MVGDCAFFSFVRVASLQRLELQGASVGCEVPEHLDQRVREGVQVHVELAHYGGHQVSFCGVSRFLEW